jgi:outer membrane receptor protein involved in Fe transport
MAIRRNFRCSLIFILFLINNLLFAGETGKISGKVVDVLTNQPAPGANIVIVSKVVDDQDEKLLRPIGAAADVNGNYFILNVAPGEYTVKCSYVGYADEVITHVKVMIDKTTQLNFALKTKEHMTGEVVVTAYNDRKVEIDLTATKQTYEIDKVRELAGIEDVSDILTLQPDIIDDHFRGGRVGQSAYLIGGASIVNPLSNQRAFSPIVTGLKTVEVLTSGFSAEYGNAQSGVINMIPKEGGQKWKTSIDASGVLPYYKTWGDGRSGSSPYAVANMPYYTLLQDINEWVNGSYKNGTPNWNSGNKFTSYYFPAQGSAADSANRILELARISQLGWQQSVRDVGLQYANTVDSRVDLSFSGPISETMNIFVAGRQRVSYEIVPTVYPDMYRQVMSNLTYQPSAENKFVFRFIWDNSYENSYSTSSWLRWLFNREFTMNKVTQNTYQTGFDWTNVLSAADVFNLKVNYLNVYSKTKVELLNDDQYASVYNTSSNWYSYYGPSDHEVGYIANTRGYDKVQTFDMHASINSQLNRTNLIKAGIQFTYNNLATNRDNNISNSASYRKISFNVYPYEGAFYAQDKLEYEGFIANVGLRLDYYDLNADYYANLYQPLLKPIQMTRAKLYTKLQPRIGFSFPVSENSVFHINYGTFTQRPSYDEIFHNEVSNTGTIVVLGNPRLKPENTKMYDLGIVNSFSDGTKLDISAYYKDVKDLVDPAYFSGGGSTYYSYANRDYADIKGFFVTLEHNGDNFDFFIRYNYESSTGKTMNSLDAAPTYYQNGTVSNMPSLADMYMDYDRPHKVTANLRYKLNDDEGFELLGVYPFENTSIGLTMRILSGRPYDPNGGGRYLLGDNRTPTEYDLRARIQKMFKFGGTQFTIYAEGYNLLNMKTYNYNAVFNNSSNDNTTRYVNNSDVYYYTEYAPYSSSQGVYIYANQPLNVRLGAILNF